MAGPVAAQTQRAHVRQVALAAALRYRKNVVGVPEMPSMAPLFFELAAGGPVELALVLPHGFGVKAAHSADTAVAREDLLAQVAGVGSQLPFVNAVGAAKSEPAFAHLDAAPAAEAALALDPSAGHRAAGAHSRKS